MNAGGSARREEKSAGECEKPTQHHDRGSENILLSIPWYLTYTYVRTYVHVYVPWYSTRVLSMAYTYHWYQMVHGTYTCTYSSTTLVLIWHSRF